MIDSCFGGVSQTKSLITHVKDGNGALKYRVVQDASTSYVEKIRLVFEGLGCSCPCLGTAELVYGIHPVLPGETGAGFFNGDRILPNIGTYSERLNVMNVCGTYNSTSRFSRALSLRVSLSSDSHALRMLPRSRLTMKVSCRIQLQRA